jgi:hypothetical protein
VFAIPSLLQWLYVEPNEITIEAPYIKNNIELTRKAFGLDRVEVSDIEFSASLSRDVVERSGTLLDNIRLWDWRALKSVYRQFQEIRLYYSFSDVDVDRYHLGDEYRQVMVSPREMDLESLSPESQTFVNRRFKYTHGYGLVMSPVHEFQPDGLPVMLLRGIPPRTEYPDLQVDKPQIYYGTLTDTPVVVNSKEKEFDYPKGDQNVYVHYGGTGGVPLAGLWRKFVFGSMFDGTRFLLSGYPTRESRVMFHRQVRKRVQRVAPFLVFEQDPYVVVSDKRIHWIIDAYTVSSRFPYSRMLPRRFAALEEGLDVRQRSDAVLGGSQDSTRELTGVNYVRNSVKAVVDAYDGSVSLYVFEPEDPLIQAWSGVFPDLFKARSEMPAALRRHVRYPASLLLTQGLLYAKYHMTDPAVFYNQEDVWVRATEKYYNSVRPVEPYYIMWQLPGGGEPEFSLILPFTPKGKQVMIGWLAGLCDGDNYGRLVAYKFPKERRVLGPQQVETKIDQDAELSAQLSLWDQRGSSVIRGNLLAIPIGDTLLYAEPIYLQADTAAYPELRLVALMHNDQLSYAPTFADALKGLLGEGRTETGVPEQPSIADSSVAEVVRGANRSFEDYVRHTGEGRLGEAGAALDKLRGQLRQLSDHFETAQDPRSSAPVTSEQ